MYDTTTAVNYRFKKTTQSCWGTMRCWTSFGDSVCAPALATDLSIPRNLWRSIYSYYLSQLKQRRTYSKRLL